MSQEIVEAVRDIEREKGIESGTLVAALEDALLAAYKKMPGAARHAIVEIDEQGDFRVFAVELPPDIEERLIEEARERKLEELEALEVETGERSHTLISDDDLDVDWSDVPGHLIKREDVTPENFGRIAAQTAKQVILQRIREAERAMMYDEYVDRVTEVVTGIVQQAGDRNNVLVDLGKVEALLPRSMRFTVPVTSSSPRDRKSLRICSRSASRMRCRITCFAVCAPMRPNSTFGIGCSITSSTLASALPRSWASSTESIWAVFQSGASSGSTRQRRKVS